MPRIAGVAQLINGILGFGDLVEAVDNAREWVADRHLHHARLGVRAVGPGRRGSPTATAVLRYLGDAGWKSADVVGCVALLGSL